mmetsp:Transcript_29568/g.52605  ORF Transcript_29568/g.52605 Transcript_29568/m.52605 type:complete len:175 (+) Transcript_29568:871-1395(+)
MIVMQASPTGVPGGLLTRKHGAVSTSTRAVHTCHMIALPATPTGMTAGLTAKKSGAASTFIVDAILIMIVMPALTGGSPAGPMARNSGVVNTFKKDVQSQRTSLIATPGIPTGRKGGLQPRNYGVASMWDVRALAIVPRRSGPSLDMTGSMFGMVICGHGKKSKTTMTMATWGA